MNKSILVLAAAAMLAASGAQSATLVNGSFEDPPLTGDFKDYYSGDDLGGWQVFGSPTRLLSGTLFPVDDGAQSVRIRGALRQEVTDLIVGETYKLSFSFLIDGFGANGRVNIEGVYRSLLRRSGAPPETWQTGELEFVASNESAFLLFSRDGLGSVDVLLDNVEIRREGTPMDDVGVVPLPAAGWLMLGALGGLAAARKAKRG